jgi:hypothetical protein
MRIMSSVTKTSEEENKSTEHRLVSSFASKKQTVVVGAIATALVTLCFLLLFWNRFLGLRSGDGGFSGAVYFLNGILPYRDYYCPVPPLFLARCVAVLAVFGKLPIALRGFAVFERVALALLVYGWLVRFFRVKDASFAAIVTIVASACDYADPVSSYNHFTITLAVATGFAASYALDEDRTPRALHLIGCAAGVLALTCMIAKQTIGLGVTLAIPLVVGLCLIQLSGIRWALRFLTGFAAGWVVGAGVVLGWMSHEGILRAFLTQSFVTGPAAKASHPGDFVMRAIAVMYGYWWAALSAAIVLAFAWGALRRSEKEEKSETNADSLKGILLAVLLGLVCLGASTFATWETIGFTPYLALKPAIYVSFFGSGLLTAYYLWRFLAVKLSRRQSQFALFATIAFVSALMTSLSYPAFEAMIIPGLGLVLAVLLNDWSGWKRWVVYAVCGAMLFCAALVKEVVPFGFNGWYEPGVKAATTTSSLPELRGFLLSPNTVDFADTTVRIIREHSSPADTIFIYPEIGIFYGLTERRCATFSLSHNMDTVPDAFAREEAQRLLRARPAVLIYGPKSEGLLLDDERTWRQGRRSGQRDLVAAVEALARVYVLVHTTKLYPFGEPVYFFVRPDKSSLGTQGEVLHR